MTVHGTMVVLGYNRGTFDDKQDSSRKVEFAKLFQIEQVIKETADSKGYKGSEVNATLDACSKFQGPGVYEVVGTTTTRKTANSSVAALTVTDIKFVKKVEVPQA